MARPEEPPGVVLSPAQQRSRRARNVAIGIAVALLVAIVYALTIAKLGGHVGDRAL
jgi:capsular polysaccharide biosynthesis protein